MSHCPIDARPQYLELGRFSFSSCPLLVSTRMKYFVFVSMLKRKSVYFTPKNGLVYSLVVRCDDFSSSGKNSPGKNFASLLNLTIFLKPSASFYFSCCVSFWDDVMIFFPLLEKVLLAGALALSSISHFFETLHKIFPLLIEVHYCFNF